MSERGIVYVCPSCERHFDSPSVCGDGTEAKPVLMTVTREQAEHLMHFAGFTGYPSGVTRISCRCGWSTMRRADTTDEHLWRIFAGHVNAAIERSA